MAIRKIAQIGHPVLRQVARDVTREELASPKTQAFIDDLVETMHDADGAGLAAIQVYDRSASARSRSATTRATPTSRRSR